MKPVAFAPVRFRQPSFPKHLCVSSWRGSIGAMEETLVSWGMRGLGGAKAKGTSARWVDPVRPASFPKTTFSWIPQV